MFSGVRARYKSKPDNCAFEEFKGFEKIDNTIIAKIKSDSDLNKIGKMGINPLFVQLERLRL